MSTRDVIAAQAPAVAPDHIQVLLVEDDDGDALLVEELLLDAGAPVTALRARTLAETTPLPPGISCVLLDLGLPDARGLDAVRWLHEELPGVAVVVLTGLADEHLGAAAVRAGAQDYLVKGQVDGLLLYRVIRYAVERRSLDEAQRQLEAAQIVARENARLERGLLPSPVLTDPQITVAPRYRPGGGQSLLGGDFYDVVETADGWVHALVGDVCGRGPDEAALGVCLRVAWRTMVLAGRPMGEPLSLAGPPPPLLLSGGRARELSAPTSLPLGIGPTMRWRSSEVSLGTEWSALMYTDGLIEGRIGTGTERLGGDGLIELAETLLSTAPTAGGRQRRDDELVD